MLTLTYYIFLNFHTTATILPHSNQLQSIRNNSILRAIFPQYNSINYEAFSSSRYFHLIVILTLETTKI